MGKNNELFRKRIQAAKCKKNEKEKKEEKANNKVEIEVEESGQFSKLYANRAAREDAEFADEKRKEEYLKVVYKKLEENDRSR